MNLTYTHASRTNLKPELHQYNMKNPQTISLYTVVLGILAITVTPLQSCIFGPEEIQHGKEDATDCSRAS